MFRPMQEFPGDGTELEEKTPDARISLSQQEAFSNLRGRCPANPVIIINSANIIKTNYYFLSTSTFAIKAPIIEPSPFTEQLTGALLSPFQEMKEQKT